MLEVLYHDPHFIAVDKPCGMLVHRNAWCPREPACLDILRHQVGGILYPVHRLDRATSGVLLFALDPEAAGALSGLFRERRIVKSYLAVVRGYVEVVGSFDDPLQRGGGRGALPARTDFERQAIVELHAPVGKYSTGRYSLVALRPRTGRHHQIRRHLAHAAHPVIGDSKHGDRAHNLFFNEELGIGRLLLMATDLVFDHPFDTRRVAIHAHLPSDVRDLFARFGWPTEQASLRTVRGLLPAACAANARNATA